MQVFLNLLDLQIEDLKSQLVHAAGDDTARLQGAAQKFIALRHAITDTRIAPLNSTDGAYI
jgi:hypothetical protein